MDKNNFISLLNHYSRSTVSEALEILALKQRYPYSQLLHALSAKMSKDHGFSTQQQELQQAAVYAADRTVLKEVMAASHELESDILDEKTTTETFNKEEVQIQDRATVELISAINSVDLTESILKDLQQLNKSRRDFELMFAEGSAHPSETPMDKSTAEEQSVDLGMDSEKSKSAKSKKERIIELARAKAGESTPIPIPEKPLKKRGNTGEVLIDEIASTKKEINPETEKQKAQIEIIDQFIKAQPIIANAKDKTVAETPLADLSTIKSGEFGDNIVSETLVDILIKQGKKDKAIEVLKKLIWKFPQKKAYFAAQIEELKK